MQIKIPLDKKATIQTPTDVSGTHDDKTTACEHESPEKGMGSEQLHKKKGHRTAKTEVIHVRFNPRMRATLEIASRIQNQSVSGFIESALDSYFRGPSLDKATSNLLNSNCKEKPETFSDFLECLWDANEVVRFLKLAQMAPSLLTKEEDKIWSFLCSNDCFKLPSSNGGVGYNVKLIRFLWSELMEYASTEHFDHGALKMRIDFFMQAQNIALDRDKLDNLYAAWEALWSDLT